jgi:hypothetical protein
MWYLNDIYLILTLSIPRVRNQIHIRHLFRWKIEIGTKVTCSYVFGYNVVSQYLPEEIEDK